MNINSAKITDIIKRKGQARKNWLEKEREMSHFFNGRRHFVVPHLVNLIDLV
jgi:hypothetical protein